MAEHSLDVTYIGHAGLLIEAGSKKILCDPWFNPAYLCSWFPFPDNSYLKDRLSLGEDDFIFVSHLHQDHFDPSFLKAIPEKPTVLLPQYPVPDLESALRALGFKRFVTLCFGQELDLGAGLKVVGFPLITPADGPLGDCALVVIYEDVRLLNLNDARPPEMGAIARYAPFDAIFLQHSGAIWYPMTYQMSEVRKARLIRSKRENQLKRVRNYLKELPAKHVFPAAGPPCFLDDELFHFNDLPGNATIFYDALTCLAALNQDGLDTHNSARRAHLKEPAAHLLYPGARFEIERDGLYVDPSLIPSEALGAYEEKEAYLRAYADRNAPVLKQLKASLPRLEEDELVEAAKAFFEPYLKAGARLSKGVNGRVLMSSADGPAFVLDFLSGEVSAYQGQRCRYGFEFEGGVLEHAVTSQLNDWVNEVFLSMRFSAWREGAYNEYLYSFFKALDPSRMAYVESYYCSPAASPELVKCGGKYVPRHCPHMAGDLLTFGEVSGDVLTCTLHGWRFDLTTGQCLTSDDRRLLIYEEPPDERTVVGEVRQSDKK